jgi:hypothetical protein
MDIHELKVVEAFCVSIGAEERTHSHILNDSYLAKQSGRPNGRNQTEEKKPEYTRAALMQG